MMRATTDANGEAVNAWQTTASRGRWATAGTPTGTYTATVTDVTKDGYTLNVEGSVMQTTFVIQ